jgi:hypothetical protein
MYSLAGSIICDGGDGYTISGNAVYHIQGINCGQVAVTGGTITLSGTRAFTAFARSRGNASLQLNSNTFSGSATGARYDVSLGGAINVNGAGATYLPGNASGINDGTGAYG